MWLKVEKSSGRKKVAIDLKPEQYEWILRVKKEFGVDADAEAVRILIKKGYEALFGKESS